MFGFGGATRRKREVAEIAGSIAGTIAAMHPQERATVLVLTNSLLGAVAAMHGPPLKSDPAKAGTEAVDAALKALLPRRKGDAEVASDEKSPFQRHAAIDLAAVDLACVTLGTALLPEIFANCRSAWLEAWKGKERLADAVVWIRRYETGSGVPAVPPSAAGRRPTDPDLMRLGASVPVFLRRKA